LSNTEELTSLIEAAVRAPSSHNTQPWSFSVARGVIALRADRTRALPVNDPFDRELTISCGAALFHLRVAAAHAGLGAAVTYTPDPDDVDLLAKVQIGSAPADAALAALFPAIHARFTTRAPFRAGASVEADTPLALQEAATAEGAGLHVLAGQPREALADLVAEGDRAQFADPSWRRELAAWMHPRRRGDGLTAPLGALTVSRLVVRAFDLGDSVGSKDHELVRQAPLVGVLSTGGDEAHDWLTAGQALARMLLQAARRGLAAGYANQPCQIEALRPRLAALLPAGRVPQIVLRLGVPTEHHAPSPRRPVAEVIEP
jgi:nitroreductase